MQKHLSSVLVSTATLLQLFPLSPVTAATLYNGWLFTNDPRHDSLQLVDDVHTAGNNSYDILGMAIKNDIDTNSIWVAINTNMPYTGRETGPILGDYAISNNNIGWGDLFFDFTGLGSFQAANGSLFGVHFGIGNDSSAYLPGAGLYRNVTATSVVTQNAGYSNLWNHNNRTVQLSGQSASMGDLPWNDSYFAGYTTEGSYTRPESLIPNAIASGEKVSDLEYLTNLELIGGGLDASFWQERGDYILGFRFQRPADFVGDFVATVLEECVNDGLSMVAALPPAPPPLPPVRLPNGGECTITMGQMNPLLPSYIEQQGNTKIKYFNNVTSGEWYDPEPNMGFDFMAELGTLFTAIRDFPCGIDVDDTFTVSVGDIDLGQFGPGDSLVFSDFADVLGDSLIWINGTPIGVPQFTISDIQLKDGKENFFAKVEANRPNFSFIMEPTPKDVPEPGAVIGLVALGVGGLFLRRSRS